MTHEQDMTLRHYQPAGGSSWCGAISRVIDREQAGQAERHAVLKVPTTTNIVKVTCPECRKLVANFVTNTWADSQY